MHKYEWKNVRTNENKGNLLYKLNFICECRHTNTETNKHTKNLNDVVKTSLSAESKKKDCLLAINTRTHKFPWTWIWTSWIFMPLNITVKWISKIMNLYEDESKLMNFMTMNKFMNMNHMTFTLLWAAWKNLSSLWIYMNVNMKLMTMNKVMNMKHMTKNKYELYEPNFSERQDFLWMWPKVSYFFFPWKRYWRHSFTPFRGAR